MVAVLLLGAMVLLPMCGFAVLAGMAGLGCWVLFKTGLLRRVWHFGVTFPALAGAWPCLSIRADQQAIAACRAAMGDLELSCGGEIGGVLIFVFKSLLVLAALGIGPILGIRLGRHCLRAQGPTTK